LVRAVCLLLVTLAACGFAAPSARDRRLPSEPRVPAIEWRHSRALGVPGDGRLVRGVRLPAAGAHFFTWDPVLHRSPNRAWRRWGTDQLVRVVLRVVRGFAADHPGAARIGVGDLSLPHGGYFGPKHATHQNGLDADIYYPRLDKRERPPTRVEQIDLRLAQDLVDRFVAAGAELVYVGPNTPLTGPPGVVIPLWNHDNHLHVRIRFRALAGGNR
jgi:murein endopeptidase